MIPKIQFHKKKIPDKIFWNIKNDPFIYFVFNLFNSITPRTNFQNKLIRKLGHNGLNAESPGFHKRSGNKTGKTAQKYIGNILWNLLK